MSYYTAEDRRKAAHTRMLKSKFRQFQKSPEDAFDIWEISVPRVLNKPTLDEYNLPNNAEEHLKKIDEEYILREKPTRIKIALIVSIGVVLLFYNIPSLLPFFILIFFGGIILWAWALNVEPRQTFEHAQFNKYKLQLSYFEYWQRKENKDHWNRMTGHRFERAVANLFRNIGYGAAISKRGGDGGIDIVIEQDGRRIAIQCKRHDSAVGPHVIRDLWGTMHHLGFNEGCIVTTTGFTSGVINFARNKNIYLIDLNDIIRSTREGGEEYLRQKISKKFALNDVETSVRVRTM